MSKTTGPTRGTRDAAMERDGFACFRCGASILKAVHILHERRPGPSTAGAANILVLCGTSTSDCGGRVESDRVLAQRLGYIINPGVDPLRVPVFHHNHGFVLLDRVGRWHRAHQRVIDSWEDECA